jgi:hypothetical protein
MQILKKPVYIDYFLVENKENSNAYFKKNILNGILV